jgi:BA14K-like protein
MRKILAGVVLVTMLGSSVMPAGALVLPVGEIHSTRSSADTSLVQSVQLREERRDVMRAEREVRRERRDVRRADTPHERRRELRDLRDARRDLREERRELRQARRYYVRNGRQYYRDTNGAEIFAGVVGAVAGAAAANSNANEVAYCSQRFRSDDPASGTYLGYDGLRHPCP